MAVNMFSLIIHFLQSKVFSVLYIDRDYDEITHIMSRFKTHHNKEKKIVITVFLLFYFDTRK